MSRFSHLTDRALELAEQAGVGLRHAGHSVSDAGHSAADWLRTGAAIGAARAGAKAAGGMVRRNPVAVAAAAAVVGAGVLAYVVYRKRRQHSQGEPIEGQSRRLPPRRVPAPNARSRNRSGASSSEA
jgi:uncharacterized membrane protein YebE (DUF533 family)